MLAVVLVVLLEVTVLVRVAQLVEVGAVRVAVECVVVDCAVE